MAEYVKDFDCSEKKRRGTVLYTKTHFFLLHHTTLVLTHLIGKLIFLANFGAFATLSLHMVGRKDVYEYGRYTV